MYRRLLGTLMAILCAHPALADDKKPALDMAAAMAAMQKHAEVGPFHKKLEPLIGDWTYKASFMMEPGGPAFDMAGVGTRRWIMDGRFMMDDAKSEGGEPFRGLGITGYDNALKKYVGVWVDSMTTSIVYSTGEVDSSGKVFTYHREEYNPMYGQKVKARDVIRIIDGDHHEMDFYTTPPGGKEFKSGTIKFTRRK